MRLLELRYRRTNMEQPSDRGMNALARNTVRAYKSDWADFSDWCRSRGVSSMPGSPETVANYLAHLSRTYKVSTLQRRLVSITRAHRVAGFDTPVSDPVVRETWDRITRPKPVSIEAGRSDSWAVRLARVKGASDLMFH